MSERILLPVCLTRSEKMPILAANLMVFDFIVAVGMYFVFIHMQVMTESMALLVSCVVAFNGVVAPLVLMIATKPAAFTISRTSLTIEPLPLFGMRLGAMTSRSITDFTSIGLKESVSGQGSVHRLVFRGKSANSDVVVDVPQAADPTLYAQQLGETLNIKVDINA